MSSIPAIIPISDLRQDAAAVLRRARASEQPLVITQRGRAAAVLLSIAVYERAAAERAMLQRLIQGKKEIAAGVGYDLDEVMADADALLAAAVP